MLSSKWDGQISYGFDDSFGFKKLQALAEWKRYNDMIIILSKKYPQGTKLCVFERPNGHNISVN